MCFSTFTQIIWIDYRKYYQKAGERTSPMLKRRSENHNTLRNFLCDNIFKQLEVACAKRLSARIPTEF